MAVLLQMKAGEAGAATAFARAGVGVDASNLVPPASVGSCTWTGLVRPRAPRHEGGAYRSRFPVPSTTFVLSGAEGKTAAAAVATGAERDTAQRPSPVVHVPAPCDARHGAHTVRARVHADRVAAVGVAANASASENSTAVQGAVGGAASAASPRSSSLCPRSTEVRSNLRSP